MTADHMLTILVAAAVLAALAVAIPRIWRRTRCAFCGARIPADSGTICRACRDEE